MPGTKRCLAPSFGPSVSLSLACWVSDLIMLAFFYWGKRSKLIKMENQDIYDDFGNKKLLKGLLIYILAIIVSFAIGGFSRNFLIVPDCFILLSVSRIIFLNYLTPINEWSIYSKIFVIKNATSCTDSHYGDTIDCLLSDGFDRNKYEIRRSLKEQEVELNLNDSRLVELINQKKNIRTEIRLLTYIIFGSIISIFIVAFPYIGEILLGGEF